MKNKTLSIIALFILAVIIFGFVSKPGENQKYQYMQISQRGKNITISSSAGYSERKIEGGDILDASQLMIVAEEYQNSGWEVINGFNGALGGWYVHNLLLRKPK